MSKEIKIEEPTDDEIFEYLNQFWKSCEDGLCYIFTTKHIEPKANQFKEECTC